jgi:hypothetical protein
MERSSSDRRDWLTTFREWMIRSGSHALGTTETQGILVGQAPSYLAQFVHHGIQFRDPMMDPEDTVGETTKKRLQWRTIGLLDGRYAGIDRVHLLD